jgi:hypothetical protein
MLSARYALDDGITAIRRASQRQDAKIMIVQPGRATESAAPAAAH